MRPSSGAAMLENDVGVMEPSVLACWLLAAPEDGRTPQELFPAFTAPLPSILTLSGLSFPVAWRGEWCGKFRYFRLTGPEYRNGLQAMRLRRNTVDSSWVPIPPSSRNPPTRPTVAIWGT